MNASQNNHFIGGSKELIGGMEKPFDEARISLDE
jgi:hypothetical protein